VLTTLEVCVALAGGRSDAGLAGPSRHVTLAIAEAALGTQAMRYGRDEHYDVVSAFIKSIRGSDPDAGLFNHPTIVDGVTAGDDLYSTETFGPIVGVASFSDFDEAIDLANGHGYGLSASIYTTDPKSAFRFREQVSAGMVSVNNSTSGAEAHLPFGGNGKSGNGSRQSGIWVLDQFTRWQALNWDYSGKLQRAQMDAAELGGDPGFRL